MEASSRGPADEPHPHGNKSAERPKKLRSTCDRCTMLKVRCDKRKPRCERCESVQELCVYGPYRWRGNSVANRCSPSKVSLSTSGRSASQGNPEDARLPKTNQHGHFDGISKNSVPSFPAFPAFPGDLEWEDPLIDGGDLDSLYARWIDDDSQEIIAMSDAVDCAGEIPEEKMQYQSPDHCIVISPLYRRTHSAPDTTIPEPRLSSPEPKTSSGHACLCTSQAFNDLQDMYHAESRYRVEGGNSSSPLNDQMVKMNRAAVHNLERLLSCDCTACSRDTSMPFLVMTISSKVLAWYRAVFNVIARQSSAKYPVDILEPALVTPIHFGDFQLDFTSEQRMKAQFLLCEVQKLSRVFDRFEESAMRRVHDDPASMELLVQAVRQFRSSTLNNLTTDMNGFCVAK